MESPLACAVRLFEDGASIRRSSRDTGVPLSAVKAELVRLGLHCIVHKKKTTVCARCGRKFTPTPAQLISSKFVCEKCLAQDQLKYALRRRGLTQDEYEQMLEQQNGRCCICGRKDHYADADGRLRRLTIDHDHRKGHVRGLLCRSCNRGLGLFRDDPKLLGKAMEYLKSDRQK